MSGLSALRRLNHSAIRPNGWDRARESLPSRAEREPIVAQTTGEKSPIAGSVQVLRSAP